MNEKFNTGETQVEHKETIEEIAHENFAQWAKSLLTKEPKSVAKLYANDASFLPTVSDEFKKGPKGAEEYFEHFLEKDPIGEIVDEEIQDLDNDKYLHSGMYNFEIGPEDNRQIVEARFSLVWRKNDIGEWKIIHHHSSMKPKI